MDQSYFEDGRIHWAWSEVSIVIWNLSWDPLSAQLHASHKGVKSNWHIQSTLVISNSKGLTETLRDIRTSTYQGWESEEDNKLNNHI